jgi:hypothetical protein
MLTKKSFTLKKFKSFMGQDCLAFTGEVYIDGKKAFHVSNDGNGGSHSYYMDRDTEKKVLEFCASQPATVFDWGTIPYDIESLIDELIDQLEVNKLCKTKTVFKVDSKEYIYKAKFCPEVKTNLLKEFPTAVFMNEQYA